MNARGSLLPGYIPLGSEMFMNLEAVSAEGDRSNGNRLDLPLQKGRRKGSKSYGGGTRIYRYRSRKEREPCCQDVFALKDKIPEMARRDR